MFKCLTMTALVKALTYLKARHGAMARPHMLCCIRNLHTLDSCPFYLLEGIPLELVTKINPDQMRAN